MDEVWGFDIFSTLMKYIPLSHNFNSNSNILECTFNVKEIDTTYIDGIENSTGLQSQYKHDTPWVLKETKVC